MKSDQQKAESRKQRADGRKRAFPWKTGESRRRSDESDEQKAESR
jgi:hypothetical protein